MGDVLTLTGANFHPPGGASQVIVHFGEIPMAVNPSSNTSLTVTVPSGATSGPVTITTTALANGQWVEQTSGSLDLLVIWTDFSPYPNGLPAGWIGDALLPGAADDLYLVKSYNDPVVTGVIAYKITDQGQASQAGSLYWRRSTGHSQRSFFRPQMSARNPATGQIYSLLLGYYDYPQYNPPFRAYEIRNLSGGALLLATEADFTYGGCPSGAWGTSTYSIVAFGFDAQGNLLVIAEMPECTHLVESGYGSWVTVLDRSAVYNFWWYPAASLNGSYVTLTPDTALLPAPIPMDHFVGGVHPFASFGLAVAPSGEAICRVYWTEDSVNGEPPQLEQVAWAIPPLGSQEPVQQLPEPPIVDWQNGFMAPGTVAADCMGRFYAMGADRSGSGAAGPIVEYERAPGAGGGWIQNTYTAASGQGGVGCATSPLTNPDHLSADAYGNLYEAGWIAATNQRSLHRFSPCELLDPNYYDDFNCCPANVPLAGLVHKARGEQLQIECSTGTLKLKLTPEPGDPISGDPGDPDTFAWITPESDGKATAEVLFGQAPKLEAVWLDHPGATGTNETVKWEVSQESAPGADPKGLYPSQPELPFTGGANPYTNSALQFQTVHLGTFILKATTTNTQHKGTNGQPAFIEVTVTVAHPDALNDLGPAHHEYDGLIIYYADKYGIPPQYIKSQVYEESAFKPNAYRYEPLSYDMAHISTWLSSDWSLNGYDSFKLPSGPDLTPSDFDNRDTLTHIVAIDFRVQPPVLPYTCDTYHHPSDVHAYFFDMFIAQDGWQKDSYPHSLYNAPNKDTLKGPCLKRKNWSKEHSTPVAWHDDVFYCGSTQTAACESGQQGFITWLLNHWDYEAQTAICSSYGLMQPMYTTAVQDMQWRKGEPAANRDPVFLFNPSTALDLGVGYDSNNTKKWAFGSDASHPWGSLFDYQRALLTGFRRYNYYGEKYIRGLHITQGYIFRPY